MLLRRMLAFLSFGKALLLPTKKCELNRETMCNDFYNQTSFPNMLNHTEQSIASAALQDYSQLVSSQCSKNLRLFLCSVYIPMCSDGIDVPILPCRSLCEESKASCEKVMVKYVNLHWPAVLKCSQYPEKSKQKLCINQPGPTIKTVHPNTPTIVTDHEKIIMQCDHPEVIAVNDVRHEMANCDQALTRKTLQNLCRWESSCKFLLPNVTNHRNQPNTCMPDRVGNTIINYKCKTAKRKSFKVFTLKPDEDKHLDCGSRNIVIQTAQLVDVKCHLPDLKCAVIQKCEGKVSCPLLKNEEYLNIPSDCRSQSSNLEIKYYCQKRPKCIHDASGESEFEIRCAFGLIRIYRADSTCDKDNQLQCKASLDCDKKTHCTITGNKEKCRGHKITVQYTCCDWSKTGDDTCNLKQPLHCNNG